MLNYYFSTLTNFSFSGRARRAEYWWFHVANAMIAMVLDFAAHEFGWELVVPDESPIGIPSLIYSVLTLVQGIALTVRRFHDRGLSGWWTIPIVLLIVAGSIFGTLGMLASAIPLIVIAAWPGVKGENKYGPDPKAEPV